MGTSLRRVKTQQHRGNTQHKTVCHKQVYQWSLAIDESSKTTFELFGIDSQNGLGWEEQ